MDQKNEVIFFKIPSPVPKNAVKYGGIYRRHRCAHRHKSGSIKKRLSTSTRWRNVRRPCRARNAPKVSSRNSYSSLTKDQICLLHSRSGDAPPTMGSLWQSGFGPHVLSKIHDFLYVQTGIQEVRACQTSFFPGHSPSYRRLSGTVLDAIFGNLQEEYCILGWDFLEGFIRAPPSLTVMVFGEAVSVPISYQRSTTPLP
jgi:hypothetical protein